MRKLAVIVLAVGMLLLPLDYAFARGGMGGGRGGGMGGTKVGGGGRMSPGVRKQKKDQAKMRERRGIEDNDAMVRQLGKRRG